MTRKILHSYNDTTILVVRVEMVTSMLECVLSSSYPFISLSKLALESKIASSNCIH